MTTADADVMIDLTDAAKSAISFVEHLYGELAQPIYRLMLEEIRLSDDGDYWLVTIGFDRPAPDRVTVTMPLGWPSDAKPAEPKRAYKQVKVDAHTGDCLSISEKDAMF